MTNNFSEYIDSINYLKAMAEIANRENVEAFIVGGYVRDLLLNRKRVDIDILVVGDGPNFARKVAKSFGVENVNIFANFGTAQFKFNNIDFEFVGARKESYDRNSRKPNVNLGSFEDDINRRDFTINTLAISLNRKNFGELIDKFNGLEDLRNQIIKTPLDPQKTFDDDPLRILRAFRFAAQLNFHVNDKILQVATEIRERLKIVSQERITDEFLKILKSPKPSVGLKLLYNTKVMEIVFPEIANLGGVDQRKDYHHKDVFIHTCQVVDNVAIVSDNLWLRFTALVHDIAKPKTKRFIDGIGWTFHGHEELGARMMKSIFKKLKLPFSKLNYVEKLVRLHLRPIALVSKDVTDSAIRRFIVSAGEDLDDLITLCRADITSKNPEKVAQYLSNYNIVMEKVKDVEEKDELRAFQSPVKGNEIMKVFNLKPSRKVGEIKKAIENAILDGKIENNYDAAYKFMLELKNKLNE